MKTKEEEILDKISSLTKELSESKEVAVLMAIVIGIPGGEIKGLGARKNHEMTAELLIKMMEEQPQLKEFIIKLVMHEKRKEIVKEKLQKLINPNINMN